MVLFSNMPVPSFIKNIDKKTIGFIYLAWVALGVLANLALVYNSGLFYVTCYDLVEPQPMVMTKRQEFDNETSPITMKDSTEVCTSSDQCGNGVCTIDNLCQCNAGYKSVDQVCDYRMNWFAGVWLLSFAYGGFGVDWFVLARGNGCYICGGVGKLLTAGGCCIWWLVDWIRILTNSFPDGNGQELFGSLAQNI